MKDLDLEKYRDLFFTESREHIDRSFSLLAEIKKKGSDKACLNELFRCAHSIKGMAASMEYNDISRLAHALESLFERIRNQEKMPSSRQIKEMFSYVEALEALILKQQGEETKEVDVDALVKKIETERSEDKSGSGKSLPLERTEMPKAANLAFEASIDASSDAPAARAYMVLRRAKEMGDVLSSEPSIAELRDGKFKGTIKIFLSTRHTESAIREAIEEISGVRKISFIEIEESSGTRKTKSIREQTVRVKGSTLDEMLREVGELIVSLSQLRQAFIGSITQEQELLFENTSKAISRLKNTLFSVRLVPLSFLTDRLPRVVLEAAQKTGKDVELVIDGENLEVDRLILDSLHDPLTHIIRNSVDHGIETPDERARIGKLEKGRIEVTCRRVGEFIEIEIKDDGRGMNADALKEKAKQQGIITPEQAERMSYDEALYLASFPGISTASVITSTSGRGVGLDVVKSTVENIGGVFTISSTPGVKTSISLKLPINISIVNALIVRIADQLIAIPLAKIERVLELVHGAPDAGQELFEYNSKMIKILPGGAIFNKVNGHKGSIGLLLGARREEYILRVDELVDERELYVNPVPMPLSEIKSFLGVSIDSEGKPIFLLDPYYVGADIL